MDVGACASLRRRAPAPLNPFSLLFRASIQQTSTEEIRLSRRALRNISFSGRKSPLRSGFKKITRVRSGLKYSIKASQVSTASGILFGALVCNALAKFQRVPNSEFAVFILFSVFLRNLRRRSLQFVR